MDYMDERMLGLFQAAKFLGCTQASVRKALESGAIKGFRLHPNGRWKVSVDELERFVSGDNVDVKSMKDELASIDWALKNLYSLFVDIRVALDKVLQPAV